MSTTEIAVEAVAEKLTGVRFVEPPKDWFEPPCSPEPTSAAPQPSHGQPGEIASVLFTTYRMPTTDELRLGAGQPVSPAPVQL